MRDEIREHIRKAQEAELDGDAFRAVRHLEQAAGLHLEVQDWRRAAALYRHCLRLMPDRQDLREALERAESVSGADTPAVMAPSPELEAALAAAEAVEAEAIEVEPPRVRRELPPRGPTPADPSIDCWCSFCCRPKTEAGAMVSGPAGAFICSECVVAAAAMQGVELGQASFGQVEIAAEPDPELFPSEPPDLAFVEDAVALSRALGWSLAEVRGLSPEERAHARRLAAPARKSAKKSVGLGRKKRPVG